MDIGIVLDDDPELGMIAIVWAGIVIERINRTVTDGAYRAPEEVAKVDDQVRWNAIYFFVNFFGFENFCSNVDAIVVEHGLELGLELIAESFNFVRLDNASRLTSLDIEKDTSIV